MPVLERPDPLRELVQDDADDLHGLMHIGHSFLPRLALGGVLGELVERVTTAHLGSMLEVNS